MATANYFMIYIERKEGQTHNNVKKQMDLALDWYKVKEDLWVVWSTSTPEKWHERFGPVVKDSGSLFVCELNINNRQGWMAQSFWDWLKKSR